MPDANKHTPGPWKAGHMAGRCNKGHGATRHSGPCVYDSVFYPMEESDYSVAFAGIVSESGAPVVWTEYDELKISMADALLIAAAPDLLDVAEAIVTAFKDNRYRTHTEDHLYQGAVAAIAKVKP